MGDLISRQAAIEDIRTMIPKDARFDIKWIEMWLMQLPSAQPEMIIYCKDCMFWQRDNISCEGYARCKTGEGGIRFRRENDFCSVARRRTDE